MNTDNTSSSLDLNHCQNCGGSYGGICGQHTGCRACECVPAINIVSPQPMLMGWICPNCRGGMSPFAQRCPCMDPPFQVTCEPSWTVCASS